MSTDGAMKQGSIARLTTASGSVGGRGGRGGGGGELLENHD